LIVPIPCDASEISWGGSVGWGIDAGSLNDIITSEAGQAISRGLIEGVALSAHRCADAVGIEVSSISALRANLSRPGFTK
jgi:hypothetical protein